MTRFESLKKASTSSQTVPREGDTIVSEEGLNKKKFAMPMELNENNNENSDHLGNDQQENESDESCYEEFSPTSGEETESDEEHIEDTITYHSKSAKTYSIRRINCNYVQFLL